MSASSAFRSSAPTTKPITRSAMAWASASAGEASRPPTVRSGASGSMQTSISYRVRRIHDSPVERVHDQSNERQLITCPESDVDIRLDHQGPTRAGRWRRAAVGPPLSSSAERRIG